MNLLSFRKMRKECEKEPPRCDGSDFFAIGSVNVHGKLDELVRHLCFLEYGFGDGFAGLHDDRAVVRYDVTRRLLAEKEATMTLFRRFVSRGF